MRAAFPNTHDVGVLVIDAGQDVSSLGTAQLAGAGTLDGLATARGTKGTVFTVSGYGLTCSSQAHSAVPNVSYRSRLMATSTLTKLRSANTDGYNLQTQDNGDGRGGTCSGDSGGVRRLRSTASPPRPEATIPARGGVRSRPEPRQRG